MIKMSKTILKKELHNAIDSIEDDDLLEAVYTILNNSVHQYELTKGQRKELKIRLAELDKVEEQSLPYKKSLKEIREKIKKK